jgi:cysteine synthase B
MSVIDIIGNTPLIRLDRINPNPKVILYGKFEGANPGGSVKDRPALYLIKEAEEKGLLTKEKIILEPTSGNTGIALAIIAAAKGYRIKLVMPICVSEERRKILEALNADLILTPAEEGTDGAIRVAHQLYEEAPELYFMPNQFDNEANTKAHYETTGPEIIEQTKGEITHFVAGMGTTGTLMGVSKRLKEFNSNIQIIGVEPMPGHRIQGLKNLSESIVPKIFDLSRLDEKLNVNDEEAFVITRKLVLLEGVFVGMSAGAAMSVALKKASEIRSGVIVAVLPDRGDRYLSTSLFASICSKCPP